MGRGDHRGVSRGSLRITRQRVLGEFERGDAQLRSHRNAWHARYLRLVALGACLAFLLALGFGAASALAITGYAPVGEFGNGSVGQVPTGIAIDNATGHVLVADPEDKRIVVFESGEPGAAVLTTFGEGELTSPNGIAIDQSTGNVYVSDAGNNRIVRYTTDGAPVPTYTLDLGYTSPAHGAAAAQVGSFASPLAIDPLTGDLLVADTGNLRVERFDSGGTFLGSFDGASTPSGAFTSLFSIATGPDGTIYLIANGIIEPYTARIEGSIVESFAPDGTLDEVMRGGGGNSSELGVARSIAYDPRLEDVLITTNGTIGGPNLRPLLLILHDGQQVGQILLPAAEITETAGIAVPQSLAAPISILDTRNVEWGEGVAGVSAVKAVIVEATTPTVSAVGSSGAHLAATVNPHGNGGSASYEVRRAGSEIWTVNPEHALAAETAAEPVEEDITELLPNETYEVRLTATVLGISETSAVETFKTGAIAPGVVTQKATGISATGATLNGSVNPNGTISTWFFEYGTTTAYGSRVPLTATPAGVGRVPKEFSRAITGLTPGVTYHFRIVAENAAGTSVGADQTLVPSEEVQRAYEQVTPVEHGGIFPDPVGALALGDATGIAYQIHPADDSAEGAPFNTSALSLRGETGWDSPIDLDPHLKLGAPRLIDMKTTLGVSADGTHSFIVTNEKLTPDALEGESAANLYVKDLRDSSVRLIAATEEPGALALYINVGGSGSFLTGSSDFSRIDFYSRDTLLQEVHHSAVYRWTSTGGLEVISRLPDESLPEANVDPLTIAHPDLSRRWVSADGRTLIFSLLNGPLYMRHDNVTVPISVSQIDGEPKFAQIISLDENGDYAFFVAGPLTEGAPEGNSVYRYARETGTLERVGIEGSRPSDPPDELGRAISADGSSIVYFGAGENSSDEVDVWHNGEIKTILPAAPTFRPTFRFGQFSPNGLYLTYEFEGDVYLYDLSTAKLTCISCRVGQLTSVGHLPPGPNGETIDGQFQRAIYNQGQVFFTSGAQLVPSDTNGLRDVYVYQGGRISLVSPGDGPYSAVLMDTAKEGQEVYFTTAQPLVGQDINHELDIYDARVGGGIASQNEVPAPRCEGEVCQGPWHGAPPPGKEASEALAGEATKPAPAAKPKPVTRAQKLARALRVCHAKHNKHKRQACERAARKKFGTKPKAKAKSHKGGN